MSKEVKTNAMRILDRQKIPYRVIQYECDEFIDGLHTAQKTGAPVEQSFKTLVTRGKSGGFYVMVVPIAEVIMPDTYGFSSYARDRTVTFSTIFTVSPSYVARIVSSPL